MATTPTVRSNEQSTGDSGNAQVQVMPTLLGVGYGNYDIQPSNFVYSFFFHTVGLLLVLWLGHLTVKNAPKLKETVANLIDPGTYMMPPAKDQSGGGGGGGERDKLQVSKGKPPKFDMDPVKTPPTAIIRNVNPTLPVEQAVMVPQQVKLPQGGQVGDPLSAVANTLSNGVGYGGGMGSGNGGGLGSGDGRGLGAGHGMGTGGGYFRVGGGVTAPGLVYSPDPEYSEEARRAKYQGTVMLWIVVGPDGKVRESRVVRSLGMGLDEKATEAVRTWKFEPAKKDGQPVAVQVNVEVSFRLY